jgi:hypothetical protein
MSSLQESIREAFAVQGEWMTLRRKVGYRASKLGWRVINHHGELLVIAGPTILFQSRDIRRVFGAVDDVYRTMRRHAAVAP